VLYAGVCWALHCPAIGCVRKCLLNSSCLQSEEEDEGGSDADSGGEGGAQESHQGKRRRLDEEGILKRRERRLWEEKRDRLMFDYTQFSYYGRSVSLLSFGDS